MKNATHRLIMKFFKGTALSAVILCVLILFPARAVAQGTEDMDPELPGIQQPVAPVKVDGNVLFNVRGISSYTAEQRAASISKRIKKTAANPTISADSVSVHPGTDHDEIFAGKEFIMNVYDGDAGVENINRETLSEWMRNTIAQALEQYRLDRTQPVLIRKTIRAMGAVLLLALLLILMRWLFKRIDRMLQERIKARIDSVENLSFSLIRSTQLWKAYTLLFRTFRIAVVVVFIAVFVNYMLGQFPWTSNMAAYLLQLFLNPFLALGKGLLKFLPDLAFLIIIYLLTRYLIRLARMLFSGIHEGGIAIRNFDPDWAMPTFRIFRLMLIIFAVIIAYPYIPGSDSSAFKGVTVFIGILFSLGSSSFISNLIAGYSMTYRRAFKKGDKIQVGDQVGFVDEQEVLVTRLRSVKNEEIVIPNSVLLNSNIINYSSKARERGLIIHTKVGIGYETPWRQVEAMLKEASGRTDGLLKDPPPFVLQQSLDDFAVTYEINAYCHDASQMHLYYTALHQNILDVFNENNVQIMTPAYEGDPETPKVVQRGQWDPPLISETSRLKGRRE